MKLATLFTIATTLHSAFGASSPLVVERNEKLSELPLNKQLNATLEGILRNILVHRDFGSDMVMFNTWKDANDELYIVPTLSDDENESAAMGLGYKLITDSNKVLSASNTNEFLNVLEIKEEDVSAMGFPKLFKGCDGKSQEDLFPFGARKFMLIGVNKSSVDGEDVNASGLFNWWGGEEECDSNLFDTDHFLFFGIGSVQEDTADAMANDVVYQTEYVTVHTTITTTITQTHGENLMPMPMPMPETTLEAAPEPTVEPLPTPSGPNAEFEFQLPGNEKDAGMGAGEEVPEEVTLTTTVTTTHDKPTDTNESTVEPTVEPTLEPTTTIPAPTMTESWTTVDVESPEFSGVTVTSMPVSQSWTRTRVSGSVGSSSAINFYSDYRSQSTRRVSMTRGFNSTHGELTKNGTVPNNGFGNFEGQPWNSFFAMACLMGTFAIIV